MAIEAVKAGIIGCGNISGIYFRNSKLLEALEPVACADLVMDRAGAAAADLAMALRTGRKHRASGELTFHVLDVMLAFEEASGAGRHVELQSTCERPAAMPPGLAVGQVDA